MTHSTDLGHSHAQLPVGRAKLFESYRMIPAVEWKNVSKVYPDGHRALDGITLTVAKGEALALLGTSGSGKTTLLKTVNRLIEPTYGEIVVRGQSTTTWDPIALRRSIGYVIQEAGLMPHLDCLENVGLVPRLCGMNRRERDAIAEQRLQLVGLDPDRFARLRPHQLSGGQRQRVGVARALAAEPDLILMDEPFGALDPITRREIQAEFRELRRRLGTTVILVTHDVREAALVADRIALMDNGKIVQEGPAAEVLANPVNDFARAFFADAKAVSIAEAG
jgi:osmoprotectant transport system ATP-binding protein